MIPEADIILVALQINTSFTNNTDHSMQCNQRLVWSFKWLSKMTVRKDKPKGEGRQTGREGFEAQQKIRQL